MGGNLGLWADISRDLDIAIQQAQKGQAGAELIGKINPSAAGPEAIEMMEIAVGKYVESSYSALESALQRVVTSIEGGVQKSQNFHRDLIIRAQTPIEGLRPAIIDENIADKLSDLLSFRHAYRHNYGTFKYNKAVQNVAAAAEIIPKAAAAVETFCSEFGIKPAEMPAKFSTVMHRGTPQRGEKEDEL